MKLFLLVLSVLFFTALGVSQDIVPGSKSITDVHQWVGQHFAKGILPPFSFVYDGKNSDSFIKGWKFSAEILKSENKNEEESVYTYADKHSGLVVKCKVTCFTDFPAVEWVLFFSNTSGKNTPLIEKTAVINHSFVSKEKGSFVLHHANGSSAERKDFQPIDVQMKSGKSIYMSPPGGRSSEGAAFPFFNVEMPGQQGIMVSIGWSGKWYANVLQVDEKTVSLKSGMEIMKLVLYPKEEIRTPKICLLFWKGENRMIGHNLFRQFILNHHSRKINGHFAEYPLSGSFDYGDPAPCQEYTCLTENFAIALIKRYEQFKVLPEVFWLDAGWYTGCGWDKPSGGWGPNVGNLTIDKERFPNGFKNISATAHQVGSKFMVWFEPERVCLGTQIDREHPEWLIKLPGNNTFLYNLGNIEARAWLTEKISNLIKNEGIDYYRQDFNMDPLPYWLANDKPDRVGISEIKHIEGLYAFWDVLLERFPNLLIDNCASGGRRLDLETTSRSSPLWRTDYQYGEPNGYQCHTFGLNFYLPIHGTAIYKTDNYTFRSSLSGTAVMNWEITGRSGESIPDIQKRILDYKNLRPYFYCDYYPLTNDVNNTGNDVWLAYQLNRPDQNDGIVIAFRRDANETETIHTKLYGLDSNATYELFNEDNGTRIKNKGSVLMEGIDLTISQKPGSLLLKYHLVVN